MKKDKELRKKMVDMFEDLEAEPQAETWENIRAAIAKPKQKKGIFWKIACLLLFFMGGMGAYFMLNVQPNPSAQQGTASKIRKPFDKGEKQIGKMETKETNFDFIGSVNAKSHSKQNTKDIQTAFLPLNIRFGETEKRFNRFSQSDKTVFDSIKNNHSANLQKQIFDSNTQNEPTFDTLVKTRNEQTPKNSAIYALESREIKFSHNANYQSFIPNNFPVSSNLDSPRKNYFSANLSILSNYQLMQEQKNALHSITNPQLLPTFNAKRLGISASFAYNHVFSLRNEIILGVNAAAIPQNFTYQIQNNHIYNVKFAQNGNYSIEKQASFYQKREYLVFLGAEIMYRYRFFSGKNSPISGVLGALVNVEMRHKQLNYWLKTGLDIRLSSHFNLSSVLQYQLNRTLDENALMKTSLYGLGLGVTYRFR